MKRHTDIFFAFVRNLIYYTIFVAIIAFATRYFLPEQWNTPSLPYLILLFFSISIVVHYLLLKASEKKFSGFVNYYLGATLFKLFIYILVLIIYIYLHRSDALAFGVTFFILYLLYTVFEVFALLHAQKNGPPNVEKSFPDEAKG